MKPVALVTGAARGIGAATASALERRGFAVVRMDIEPGSGFVQGDIADLSCHPRIVEEAFAKHGALHCLVSNAGVQVRTRGSYSTSPRICLKARWRNALPWS